MAINIKCPPYAAIFQYSRFSNRFDYYFHFCRSQCESHTEIIPFNQLPLIVIGHLLLELMHLNFN